MQRMLGNITEHPFSLVLKNINTVTKQQLYTVKDMLNTVYN